MKSNWKTNILIKLQFYKQTHWGFITISNIPNYRIMFGPPSGVYVYNERKNIGYY